MAIGPCWPGPSARRAVLARGGVMPQRASCLTGRASFVLVPGLRPKARSVGHLAVPCCPLGTGNFVVPGWPVARSRERVEHKCKH